jgi:transcriptional regulator with XRE-family HTH domain
MYEKVSGQKIKQAIKEAGFTQKDFAKKIKTHQPVIQNWIRGIRNIKLSTLKKISGLTGKELQYFFDNSSNIQSGNTIYGGKNEFNNILLKDIELLKKDNELLKRELGILKREKELAKKNKK